MVRYELGNGKTIFISMEDYLDMTDEKLQEYIAKDSGYMVEDPFNEPNFKDFSLKNYEVLNVDVIVDPLDEDIVEEIIKEIKKEIDDSD